MGNTNYFPMATASNDKWWSRLDGQWYTRDEIVQNRSEIADTYLNYEGTSYSGSIANATVTIPDQTWTGEALTPELEVVVGGVTLAMGTDYTVTYTNNVNVGTATVSLRGKGMYVGTKSATFEINRAPQVVTTSQDEYVVDLGSGNLNIGAQASSGASLYSSAYATSNSSVVEVISSSPYLRVKGMGTAEITVTAPQTATYESASKTVTVRVVIPISNATMELPYTETTYTGRQLKPVPIVTYGDEELVMGSDFSVAYGSNTNAGTGTVTVVGMGDFGGIATLSFTINKATQTIRANDQTLTVGQSKALGATTTGDGTLTYATYDESIVEVAEDGTLTAVSAGEVTISVYASATNNYKSAVKRITVTVEALDISEASVTLESTIFAHTGRQIKPKVTVSLNGTMLVEGEDYELSYANNIAVGTATVTVTGIDSYSGETSVQFSIVDGLNDGWFNLPGGGKGYVKDGKLVTGWLELGSGMYYFGEDYAMLTGWQDIEVGGKMMHYYFRPSGNLARSSWADIDGTKYYFRPSGNMATGWTDIDGAKYYFDEDGKMVTGWLELDGKRYYFRPSGTMATGFATVDDKQYLFRTSGSMVTGWGDYEGKKYYAEDDGTLVKDTWKQIGSGLYYFRPSGSMATGWATVDGEKYWFRPSGNMATGWADVDDAYKRYFDDQGHMLTGWQEIGGKTYYFRIPSGAMQTGIAIIDGEAHTFSDNGVLVS